MHVEWWGYWGRGGWDTQTLLKSNLINFFCAHRWWRYRHLLHSHLRPMSHLVKVSPRNIYRPQTKFAKVMFLHVSVCPWGGSPGPHLGGEGWGAWLGGSRPTPGGSRPRRGVSQHALWQTLPPADGYCCGQYTSYWNAFLFYSNDNFHLMSPLLPIIDFEQVCIKSYFYFQCTCEFPSCLHLFPINRQKSATARHPQKNLFRKSKTCKRSVNCLFYNYVQTMNTIYS